MFVVMIDLRFDSCQLKCRHDFVYMSDENMTVLLLSFVLGGQLPFDCQYRKLNVMSKWNRNVLLSFSFQRVKCIDYKSDT